MMTGRKAGSSTSWKHGRIFPKLDTCVKSFEQWLANLVDRHLNQWLANLVVPTLTQLGTSTSGLLWEKDIYLPGSKAPAVARIDT